MILKRFDTPDEVRIMPKGRFEIVRLGQPLPEALPMPSTGTSLLRSSIQFGNVFRQSFSKSWNNSSSASDKCRQDASREGW